MSFSLALQSGDLALNGRELQTVTGPAKVYQDLRSEMLTPAGFYEKYPEYGTELEEYLGNSNWEMVINKINATINDICNRYQKRQVLRNERDGNILGRSTLKTDEILAEIQNIEFVAIETTLIIKVYLLLGNKEEIQFNVPVVLE